MNSNVITIRLKSPYIEAYNFLKEKKMKPADILRKGGQELLLSTADKYKRPVLRKLKDVYF